MAGKGQYEQQKERMPGLTERFQNARKEAKKRKEARKRAKKRYKGHR